MQRFLTAKLALAAFVLTLTGCSTMNQSQQTQTAQQADNQGAIDTICVVRHPNSMLRGDDLLKAIESGLQRVGVKTRVVDNNQLEECRLCLFYGVTTENQKVKSFDFQAVVDGRALQRGSGPIGEDGSIKLQTIADYAAGYLQSLVNAGKQKQAKPEDID